MLPSTWSVLANNYGQTMTIPDTDGSAAQASPTRSVAADDRSMDFETLTVRKEGAVLFAEIAAPPMNLLGPELSAIWSLSFSEPKPTTPSRCSCSRAPTATISFPTST
jgi:hypothetical protein